jgi:3-hydroxyacyl-[acyl-carrier-protein] dehydratase
MVECRWLVPNDHPALPGHFPGQPIVPGVLLLDMVIQLVKDHEAHLGECLRLGQVKFLSPSVPGDELVFSVKPGLKHGWAFEVHCGERTIASGTLQWHLP